MQPLPSRSGGRSPSTAEAHAFEQLLDQSLQHRFEHKDSRTESTNHEPDRFSGAQEPVYIYPYGLGRHQLEQVIVTLDLPIVLTKDLDSADVVLALRSHVKNHTKLRHLAKARQLPIHTLKSSSLPQIAQGLRRLLNLDETGLPETPADLDQLMQGNNEDELEALEEARLAVEQIVLPKGQPVELLPRSASVRKMQHELVEHYRLTSRSCGDEPNRRLRIYPA
jgi:hypothetical protein